MLSQNQSRYLATIGFALLALLSSRMRVLDSPGRASDIFSKGTGMTSICRSIRSSKGPEMRFRGDAKRNELTLAKMRGPLPIRWSRTLPRKTEPSTVTVSLDTAGRWHVSILVEETIRLLPARRNAVGIDLGVDSYAVTSDGETIANPRHYKKLAERLEREQRALSCKTKGSNNRRKAALKVARTYARITDMRRDFLHKLSTRIIRENQTVVLEDLNLTSSRC